MAQRAIHRSWWRLLCLLCVLAMHATSATANQSQQIELRKLESGEVITFDQVMKDPDNVSLNFLYAQSQIRTGEIRGAAATLERILLLHPDLASVRLLYAVVLFRLDSLGEAERELNQVAKEQISSSERTEVDRYLDAIQSRNRRTRFSSVLTMGTQYDSNRNSSPRTGTSVFEAGNVGGGQTEVELTDDSLEQDDGSYFGYIEGRIDHDLGLQEGHAVYAKLGSYMSRQLDQKDFNVRAMNGEIGGLFRTPWVDLKPSLSAGIIGLSSETFLRTMAFNLRADHHITPRTMVFGRYRFEWQDFEGTRQSPTANERTGILNQLTLGGVVQLSPSHQLDAELAIHDKWARGSHDDTTSRVYSYIGPSARVRHTWLLGGGQFLMTSAGYGREAYKRADARIDESRTRRDLKLRTGVIYGAPLSFLLGWLNPPEQLRTTLVSLNAEYYRASSNITNYSYDNKKISLMFTKSWSR